MKNAAVVALGAIAGATLRWLAGTWLGATAFPLATLLVNLAGCCMIGLLHGWWHGQHQINPRIKLGLTTGLLGGLTTFSTFSGDTVRLLERAPLWALGYQALSLLGGLLCALGGALAGRALRS